MPPSRRDPRARRPNAPFWREAGGLDLTHACLLPGGRTVEIRFRGGQVYRLAPGSLGIKPPVLLATLGPDPRALMVFGGGGELVAIPVEQVLASCEPAFVGDQAARQARASTVGARVRALRIASLRPAKEIAAAAGMAPSNYARLEASRVEPRLATLRRLANALDVPLEDLITDTRRGNLPSG